MALLRPRNKWGNEVGGGYTPRSRIARQTILSGTTLVDCLLCYDSMIDVHDRIGKRKRAGSMRNHDHGAICDVHGECIVNQAFAFNIDLTGGLIEHQDFSIS